MKRFWRQQCTGEQEFNPCPSSFMKPYLLISEMLEPEIVEDCPRDNQPVRDGTGAHLGLRPWYNDLSHEITDSSLFRILLIIVVAEHVLGWLAK